MQLDLQQLSEGGRDLDLDVDLPDLGEQVTDLAAAPQVHFEGRIEPGPEQRTPQEGAQLHGRIVADLQLQCSRCLEPFAYQIAPKVRLTLVSELPDGPEMERQMQPDDSHFLEISEPKVDLAAVIGEQIDLALPLKPICRNDCAGLCPTCGTNRNHLKCDCREEAVDPRLDALRAIRDQMNDQRD